MRALKATREIDFSTTPGVFPIKARPEGIEESFDSCGGNVMNTVTGGTVKDTCRSKQL